MPQECADELIGRHALGLGLIRQQDAVPQHIGRDGMDVFG